MPKQLQRLLTSPPLLEQRSIQLHDTLVEYTLKRSAKRRSIGLLINDNGLTVSMPLRATEKWLHSVLQERARWVVSKLQSWQSKRVPVSHWAAGEAMLFRGETYTLRVVSGPGKVAPQLTASELIIQLAEGYQAAAIKTALTRWYKIEAMRVFTECIAHFAPLMQVAPSAVKLSSARTQWGSCTSRGVIRLNWQLVTMPLPLIDYVVVHELAHLQEMNHSPAFWQVVEAVCPDYLRIRKELKRWNPSGREAA